MKYLIEKLFFQDIQAEESGQSVLLIRSAKWIALILITMTFITGTFLTARYALRHYEKVKTNFFTETESTELPVMKDPDAVWFTHEEGDPHDIQGIIVYLTDIGNDRISLDIVNINDLPVELISVQDKDGRYVYPIRENTTIQPSPTYESVPFTLEGVDMRMLEVQSEVFVNYTYNNGIHRQAPVVPFQRIDEDTFISTTVRTDDNTHLFDFIGENNQYIFFEGEVITVDQPLFIPEGKTLRINAGQEIDLINKAFIAVRAPILFEGNEKQPILIHTSDGTGRGLLVMQADRKSTINYTVFNGLDTPSSGIWGLTGAVTFYESNVDIIHSQFINNVCEDGLNIIRSSFTITDSTFANTASDAFDADFCDGKIENSVFENTANDAIDVSGSIVNVINTNIKEIGDKGISAGENSRVYLKSVIINNAVIGIASKDLSEVTGNNIAISNSRIGLTLYIKKPEFGPAYINLENYTINGNIDLEYLIQPGSTLIIDGKTILPRSAAKETLLFEKMINGEPIQ